MFGVPQAKRIGLAGALAALSFTAVAQTQYTSVRAVVECGAQDGPGTIPVRLRGVTVRLKAVLQAEPTSRTDNNGVVSLTYASFDLAPVLEAVYDGVVQTSPTPAGLSSAVASSLQVVDDVYAPRSEVLQSVQLAGTLNGDVLDLGVVRVSSVDCSIWDSATTVLDDYHRTIERSVPSGRFRVLRRGGVITGGAWTSYDTVELPTDFVTSTENSGHTRRARNCTIFHEFAHFVRHVLDGTQAHFAGDVIKYAYGRTHQGGEIFNVQYAFNEGWANYWRLRKGCGPGAPLPPDRDWNEWNVGNRLLEIGGMFSPGNPANDKPGAMVMDKLLRDSAGKIHSLHQFEVALRAARPDVMPSPPRVEICPLRYVNDGATCRLDTTQAKPSRTRGAGTPLNSCDAGQERSVALCYPRCPAGFTGNGPMCWQQCAPGFSDDGATCRRGLDISLKASRGRGAGTPLTCGPGRQKDGALCYEACPSGFTGKGPVCWGTCPAGTRDDGAVCFGSVSILIRD